MQLQAAQHVFGSLTKDQSVTRLSGYQTFFYTHNSLTKAEVEVIERRAQFHAMSAEQIKWQFYMLSDEKVVVSCLSPIAEPDEFGRMGRYLAHSMILHISDLKGLDGAPFDLMRRDLFYTTIERALAAGNLQTGELPAITFDIESSWLEHAVAIASEWDGRSLANLIRVIFQARSLAEQNKYVALIGNNEQILDAVSIAFVMAPVEAPHFCSLDTLSSGCDWSRDVTFLLRGFVDERDVRTQFVIDTVRRQVKPTELNGVSLSPYVRWIESALRTKSFRDLLGDQEHAQALTAILNGDSASSALLREMSAEFVGDFAQANARLIEERVISFLPSSFSQSLRDSVLSRAGSSAIERLHWLMKNRHGDGITDVIYQTLLLDYAQSPTASDLKAIRPFANDHSGIGLLLASWLKDEQLRRDNLAAMKQDEYAQLIKEFQERTDFAAWQVFSPTHIGIWFDLCRSSIEIEDIKNGLSSVAEYGNSWERNRTAGVVEKLEPEELKKLWQWLRSSQCDLPELQAELEYTLGILPHQKSLRNRFNPLGWSRSDQTARGVARQPENVKRLWKLILIVLAVLFGAALGLWLFRQQPPKPVKAPTITKEVLTTTEKKEQERERVLSKEAEMFDQPNGNLTRVLLPGTKVTTVDIKKASDATTWVKIRIGDQEQPSTSISKQKKENNDRKQRDHIIQPLGWIKEESLKP